MKKDAGLRWRRSNKLGQLDMNPEYNVTQNLAHNCQYNSVFILSNMQNWLIF